MEGHTDISQGGERPCHGPLITPPCTRSLPTDIRAGPEGTPEGPTGRVMAPSSRFHIRVKGQLRASYVSATCRLTCAPDDALTNSLSHCAAHISTPASAHRNHYGPYGHIPHHASIEVLKGAWSVERCSGYAGVISYDRYMSAANTCTHTHTHTGRFSLQSHTYIPMHPSIPVSLDARTFHSLDNRMSRQICMPRQ